MPNNCLRNIKGSTVVGQHLFLGSSIVSFNNNLGWGGSSSSLNLELINDISPCGNINTFNTNPSDYPDNHYYDCVDDSCYIDERTNPYNSSSSKDRIVPGKVYHVLRDNNLVSRYWTYSDPGFIGHLTNIDSNGNYNPNSSYSYNIIGCPAYFRYGYFTFGGFITSWERSNRNNTVSYTVTLSSADDILQDSKVIIDHYAGAIFARHTGSYGGPINFIDNRINYLGELKNGNIPNVFNVYGFLESYGFGASNKNDEGIPLAYVLDALSVLTGTSDVSTLGVRQAFSPFGRIIGPTITTNTSSPTIPNFGDGGFGLISPSLCTDGNLRSAFTLDLSEIPRPPLDIRISAPDSSVSISDLIRMACEKTGRDFYTTILRKNGVNVIKIKTINRTIAITQNAVSSLVSSIENEGMSTTYATFGKEQNKCSPKIMYIGGNQQRLYQAKSYTLAYSQTNYVFNPVINKFVNYSRFQNKQSVVKVPNFLSTKNTALNKQVLGESASELYDGNETIRQAFSGDVFNEPDQMFSDSNIGGKNVPWKGNYFSSFGFGETSTYSPPSDIVSSAPPEPQPSGTSPSETNPLENDSSTPESGVSLANRYMPLLTHAICPFFGYRFNEQIEIATSSNNIFRYIRPVFLDTWTGQLAVIMSSRELPVLSLGSMGSLYAADPSLGNIPLPSVGKPLNDPNSAGDTKEEDPPAQNQLPGVVNNRNTETATSVRINEFTFKITETEIRAAMTSKDSYLSYCLAKYKTEKPDLFVMLVNLYKKLNKLTVMPLPGYPSNQLQVGSTLNSPLDNNQVNFTGEAGQQTDSANPQRKKSNLNLGYTLSYEFMNDLGILVDFIQKIGEKYYGRKYLVRLPGMTAYRDKQYADIQIPSSAGTVGIYQGSGKIFFDKELVDGAWEEFGNVIDDSVVVGSPAYYRLSDDKGLIKPILGYNASFNYDDVSRFWCEKSDEFKDQQLKLRSDRNSIKTPDTDKSIAEKKKIREYDQAWANRIGASINCEKKIVPSINLGSIGQDYLLINTGDTRQDAFGRLSTSSESEQTTTEESDESSSGNDDKKRSVFYAPSQKLYVTTSCDEIAFIDPSNLIGPRAIIDAPGITLFSSSYSYTKDPNLTVIANVAIEDLAILQKKGLLTEKIKRVLSSYCIPILDTGFLVSEGDTTDQSSKHDMIQAKMAHPVYAGIPLKSNLFCYGPWTNYPSLANQNNVFPGITNSSNIVEQLISDTKVEKKDEFVPWNVGGSSSLDLLVLNTLNAELSYQSVLENGQIAIYGPPIYGLAGGMTIGSTDNDVHQFLISNIYGFSCIYLQRSYIENFVGLTLSNISTNASTNGISTNYNFRTYSQKLGLYSKENSDRIRKLSTSRISLLKKLSDAQSKFEQKIMGQINQMMDAGSSTRSSTSLSSFESKIYGRSPSEVLVGRAIHYIDPFSTPSKDPGTSGNLERHNTKAGLYMPDELKSELAKEHDSKSAMSMDGFFSPISFYPTLFGSTYALSSRCVTEELKQKNIICPTCGGKGVYLMRVVPSGKTEAVEENSPCPLCSKSKLVFPSGDNPELPQEINILSLNPIVMPYGEFRNPNSQPSASGERCRHNIAVISRSENVQTKFDSVDITENLQSLYDPETGQFAVDTIPSDESQQGLENKDYMKVMNLKNAVNKDYYDIDLSYKFSNNENILLNQRFFGFRGPMMLHGWGYDTEGYPVPNAADEPREIDQYGRSKRFILTTSGTNDLTKDGEFYPPEGQLLGDVIGKGYTKSGAEWEKTKSKYFYLNWAERPDTWPVGPIDLRWDNDRKVWAANGGGGGCDGEILPPYIVASGNDIALLNSFMSKLKSKNTCPYKDVYITLEENLVLANGMTETYPARAFIDDLEYSTQPLLKNYRRLVYVKDRCAYTAPRGAKLLCRYDTFSGFYEPISKQQYIVFGSITGGNNAVIELTYTQGIKRPEYMPRTTITFDNSRFNFNISNSTNRGMFLFESGKWILIGIN